MSAFVPLSSQPLLVRVKEPTAGLFYWVVTQLAEKEDIPDVRVDASDHPYPTHEAAMLAGSACLKAIKSLPAPSGL
jgi:glycerate-2-kinase